MRKIISIAILLAATLNAADLPEVKNVDAQPLLAQARRVVDALEFLGNPLPDAAKERLQKDQDIVEVQKILDPLCLIGININPESRVKAAPGPAALELV